MPKWATSLIAFLLSGVASFCWLSQPLWRDVRFQTGFDNHIVVLPSGHEFKPGKWTTWPEGVPLLNREVTPDGTRSLLTQDGFTQPVIIRNPTGEYPAMVSSVRPSGNAKTWFLTRGRPEG